MPAFMVAAAVRECEWGGVWGSGEADGECDCDMMRDGSVVEGRCEVARWRGDEGDGEGGSELRSGDMALRSCERCKAEQGRRWSQAVTGDVVGQWCSLAYEKYRVVAPWWREHREIPRVGRRYAAVAERQLTGRNGGPRRRRNSTRLNTTPVSPHTAAYSASCSAAPLPCVVAVDRRVLSRRRYVCFISTRAPRAPWCRPARAA